MLFSEQVRKVSKENEIDSGRSGFSSVVEDWTLKHTVNFNLSEEKIVFVEMEGPDSTVGNARALVDDVPFIATGERLAYDTARGYALLAAGAHTVKFQTSKVNAVGGDPDFKNTIVSELDFADVYGDSYDSGDVAAANGTTTTILNETIPSAKFPNRKLAVGDIKKYCLLVSAYVKCTERRDSYLKNTGEGDEAGEVSWKIEIDDTQRDWSERGNADDCFDGTNDTFGVGAWGICAVPVAAGSSHNIKVKVYNDAGAARTCRVYVKAVICPWIIPNEEYEPIDLDFPQGSTFYVTLEPMATDPTKNVKIGKKRFVSHGDATDFYSTASGTGILSHSYTFESVEVEEVLLLVSGFGGCVSILGVDVR